MAPDTTTRQTNGKNLLFCVLLSLGLVAFGYPASIIGTTLAQPAFLVYMGLVDPKTGMLSGNANGLIGAMSGVFQAGAFVGAVSVSYVIDKWGRKSGIYCCSFCSLLGGALLCGANGISMFLVGRFIAGMGSWGFFMAVPVYATELAPPGLRGFFVGLDGFMVTVGYGIASYMGLAFYSVSNPSTQWRGPLGIALIWPALMIIIMVIVPESPRWLLMNNEVETARAIIMDLHSDKRHSDLSYARGEFYQMQKQIEADRNLPSGWMDMIRKPGYRKRTLLGALFGFTAQSTGVLVLNNYAPTIYKFLGYGTRDQLILDCGWITVGIVFTFLGAFIVDRVGRKPLAMMAFAGTSICLSIEAAMVSQYAETDTNKAGLKMGVAATYIFLAFYAVGVDVVSIILYAELFPNHLRSKGMAVCISVNALSDLIYLEVTATAFATIGWRFYLVFIILTAVGGFTLFLYLPETKGVPLEEMGKLFGDTDEIVLYFEDVHVDHNTQELVVNAHNGYGITRVATEAGYPSKSEKNVEAENVEAV